MASFQEMLDASLYLIINTLAIFVFWVAGSPIIDFLSVYIASFHFTGVPVVTKMSQMIQPIFGWFFWLLVIIEVALFIRTYLMIVTKTDYQGESDF